MARQPFDYDNIILLAGDVAGDGDAAQIDSRNIVTLLLLRSIAGEQAETGRRTKIITELLDSQNHPLVARAGVKDVVISNRLVSMLIAQISQNRAIKRVYDDIFQEDGSCVPVTVVQAGPCRVLTVKVATPAEFPEGHARASVNRGKRAMTLNLKSERGAEVLRRLIERSDVLLHNFLPDTAARLGIAYDIVRAVNPRLVYCSINGYGEQGALRNKPGYDLMVQAFSGTMSTTGFEGGPPVRSGVSFIDMATGIAAYGAIVSALFARERTGKGAWVHGSLLETAVSLLGYHAISWLQGGKLPVKQGSGSASSVPYQAFQCKDGFMLLGAPNDAAWGRFCAALDDPALAADARFSSIRRRVENREILPPQNPDALIGPVDEVEQALRGIARKLQAETAARSARFRADQAFHHVLAALEDEDLVGGLSEDARHPPPGPALVELLRPVGNRFVRPGRVHAALGLRKTPGESCLARLGLTFRGRAVEDLRREQPDEHQASDDPFPRVQHGHESSPSDRMPACQRSPSP